MTGAGGFAVRRGSFEILLAAVAVLAAGPAAAQTVTAAVSPNSNAPALGTVVRGTSASTFVVAAGTGTITSTGNAIRLTGGAVTSPQITIVCKSNCAGNAASRTVTVTITAGVAAPNVASITNFTRSAVSGTGLNVSSTTSGSPLTFTITFPTMGSGDKSATFNLGLTISVPSSGATGSAGIPFTVQASRP